MIGILVILNDYFHDFATAVAIVASYMMLLLVRYVQRNDREGPRRFLVAVYPKTIHVTGGLVVLLLMAGIVRAFTYSSFEWDHTIGAEQVWLLIAKHIVMFSVFGYGLYLWIKMYKVVKAIKDK